MIIHTGFHHGAGTTSDIFLKFLDENGELITIMIENKNRQVPKTTLSTMCHLFMSIAGWSTG